MRSTGIWDDPGKNQFSPSSVVSRQTSVHHVTLSDKTIQYIQYSKAIGLVMQRYTGFTIYRGMNIYSYHTVYICLSMVLNERKKAAGWRISPAHTHLYSIFFKKRSCSFFPPNFFCSNERFLIYFQQGIFFRHTSILKNGFKFQL